MRVIILAAVMVASMPYMSPRLPSGAPSVYTNMDCAAAQRSVAAIAGALGYSHAIVNCGHRPTAKLEGAGPVRIATAPQLVSYSANAELAASPPPIGDTVQIPSSVPFVAGTGSVVGYVKIDALVVSLETDNPVETAFALENKGVARRDIASLDDKNLRLVVRVRPLSFAQMRKIVSVVDPRYDNQPFRVTFAYVSDCNRAVAAVGAIAAARAREHAGVLAKAAGTSLGQLLGVVDSGYSVNGAVCSAPGNASVKQLVMKATGGNDVQATAAAPQLFATVARVVSAAWKVNRPANPPGLTWESLPEFFDRWWLNHDRPAFIADGQRTHGDALLVNALYPDRVRIFIPDYAVKAVARSRYKDDLSYVSLGLEPLYPVVDLRASSTAGLQRSVDAFRRYLSGIPAPPNDSTELSFVYSRDDCSTVIDDALYAAARIALDKTGHMRYLEERSTGLTSGVSCLYQQQPEPASRWTGEAPVSAVAASVTIGY